MKSKFLNINDLKKIVNKNMVAGFDLTKVEDLNCEICIKGKQAQAAFPKNNECKVIYLLK